MSPTLDADTLSRRVDSWLRELDKLADAATDGAGFVSICHVDDPAVTQVVEELRTQEHEVYVRDNKICVAVPENPNSTRIYKTPPPPPLILDYKTETKESLAQYLLDHAGAEISNMPVVVQL